MKAGEVTNIILGENENGTLNRSDSIKRFELHWTMNVSPKGCDVTFGITKLFRERRLGGDGETSDGIVIMPETNDEDLFQLLKVPDAKNSKAVEVVLDNKHSWIKPKVVSVWVKVYGILNNDKKEKSFGDL